VIAAYKGCMQVERQRLRIVIVAWEATNLLPTTSFLRGKAILGRPNTGYMGLVSPVS
jgi:hypothetical protein